MRCLALLAAIPLAWGSNCVPGGYLRPTGSLEGTLSELNCRLADGTPYTEYILYAPTHGRLDLGAGSEDFPVTLLLRDSFGRLLDEGPSISRVVERGEYAIVINSTRAGTSGRFHLASAFTPEPNTLCRVATPLGFNRAASSRFSDSSCKLLNGAPYDAYLVTIFGPGTLEVAVDAPEFAAEAVLRDAEGRRLAPGAANLSLPVRGDEDLTLVVAALDSGAAGDYKVSLRFTPADGDSCRPQRLLEGSQDVPATINDSSCRFGEDLRFHYYDLRVAEHGLADLRVSSSDLNGSLALLDANGRLLSLDYDSGGPRRPILRPQLAPGEYTVLVVASRRGGDYTLQYRFQPGLPEICPVLALEDGAVVTGSLNGNASCRGRDTLQDVYRFTLPSAGNVEIVMSSGDLDTLLILRDAKDNATVGNDSIDGSPSRILADLGPGVYSVLAAGFTSGGYTLSFRFTPGDLLPCRIRNLALNGGFIADLGSEVCRGADGQPVDYFEFRTPVEGTVAGFLTSSEIDGYLTLHDAAGGVLRRDDNSYGQNDAVLIQHLPAGTYRLGVRSAYGGERGRYRVDVLFVPGERPSGCLPIGDAPLAGVVTGSLRITSCQYHDDTFADLYRLEVIDTTTIDVTLVSSRFDAYLEVLDAKGSLVQFDDDSGGDTNSHLIAELEPGAYFLVVKSYAEQGYAVGEYTMTLR